MASATSWKGRFRKDLDPEALGFSSSLNVDKRLYREDIQGSIAHVGMLARRNIIPKKDAKRIQGALRRIEREIASGKLDLQTTPAKGRRFVAEDIHMAIEHRLMQVLGDVGGQLHTARSRNDQIALDERLYLRRTIRDLNRKITALQKALVGRAERYRRVVMPGYTHLQRAQPVFLAHHLLAYVSMLERDKSRFADCLTRVSLSPLGAAALAGTSFPIDRRVVAQSLGLGGIVDNSIDAVSDRDVQIEFIAACAITAMHLSRLAEELVLWSSGEWRFVDLGEEFTTGSSMMPQKKNPDMAELIRGKTGRIYGDLVTLLTVMKALPLAYNRDMQEDKEPMFDAADTTGACLSVAARMMSKAKFNAQRFSSELASGLMQATELADYLVRKGMPFRRAHAVVGSIVAECERKGTPLAAVGLEKLRRYSRLFGPDVVPFLDASKSLAHKKSEGGSSPRDVGQSLGRWKRKLRL
jgi:argininosuccinate lyase